MLLLKIVMLLTGIIIFMISFIIKEEKTVSQPKENVYTTLSEKEKEDIREQVNKLVSDELNNINERTEASLDKISNTKILEMNDYADTVMGEINKSHNEAVFLYDMLNEKAKEVKNTVKDVNVAKKEVKSIKKNVSDDTVSKSQAGNLDIMVNGKKSDEIDFDKIKEGTPENILLLYENGMSVRDIAKKFGLGVGEVNLIIGLRRKENKTD